MRLLNRLERASFPNPGRKLFFLHVPKCGGSSIEQAFRHVYSSRFRAELAVRASRDSAELIGLDWFRQCESLQAYFMSHKGMRLIAGHFFWSEKCYHAFKNEWTYVTLLREPTGRWLSNYFYDRFKTHSDFNKLSGDLPAFLETDRARDMGCNLATFLSGIPGGTSEAVQHAKANLKRFDIVGFLNDLPRFQRKLEHVLQCRVPIPHKNKSPRNDLLDRARNDPSLMARIAELCAPDQDVYQSALAHPGGKIASSERGEP